MSDAREDTKIGTLRDEIPSGIWLGSDDHRIPLWKSGSNVHFTPQGVAKIKGFATLFTKPVSSTTPIRGMAQRISAGSQFLYFGSPTILYRWNTSAFVETTGFTGNLNGTVVTPASIWSIEPFGSLVLATNGVDTPQIDTGSGTFANLTGIDFTTAEIFVKRGPHMLAFNTSINDKGFVWCDIDDVQDWQPVAANAAGDLIIRELDSEIIAAVPLGDKIAAYGKDQMFLVGYIGSPRYFGYKPGVEGIGAISKKAVVEVGRRNYGIGRHGFWETNGVSIRYIDDPAIREFFFDDVNWTQSSKVNGYHNEAKHEIIWYYPSVGGSGEPDKGLVYDYQRGLWSQLGYGRTASIERQVFTEPIVADNTGEVYQDNFGNDADGSALVASILSKPVDFGTVDQVKEIDGIRISYKGTGLQFRLGSQQDLDDAITYTSFVAVAVGHKITDIRIAGRYITLELKSSATGDNWDLSAVDVYGRLGGNR